MVRSGTRSRRSSHGTVPPCTTTEKARDLPPVRRPRVADEDARDEHGQEARPVSHGSQAVDRQGAGQDPERVQALAWQRYPAHESQQAPAPRGARGRADGQLGEQFDSHLAGRGQPGLRRGQERGEDGDADRVLGPGLTFEQRAGAPAHLTAAEYGEQHRRVGRRQRRAEQQGAAPVERQDQVRHGGHPRRRDQGARHADPQRRPRHRPQPPPARPHAAIEQDHRQGDRDDVLDPGERQIAQPGPELGRGRGRE
jgi:hypothetical protein